MLEYARFWITFSEAIDRLQHTMGCDVSNACEALLAALKDGAIRSRYAADHCPIATNQWSGATIYSDCLVAFWDPRPHGLEPERRLVELHRRDIENIWPRTEEQKYSPATAVGGIGRSYLVATEQPVAVSPAVVETMSGDGGHLGSSHVPPPAPVGGEKRRRGPKPMKRLAAEAAMKAAIADGDLTIDDLDGMKEVAMAAQYGVCRDTVRKARLNVLSQVRQIATNDK